MERAWGAVALPRERAVSEDPPSDALTGRAGPRAVLPRAFLGFRGTLDGRGSGGRNAGCRDRCAGFSRSGGAPPPPRERDAFLGIPRPV